MEKIKRNQALGMTALCLICTYFLLGAGTSENNAWQYRLQRTLFAGAQELYLPSLGYLDQGTAKTPVQWVVEKAAEWIPIIGYVNAREQYEPAVEDDETIARILAEQANDENHIDENGNLITTETAGAVEAEPLEEPEEEGFFAEEEPEVEAAADTQEDSGTLV